MSHLFRFSMVHSALVSSPEKPYLCYRRVAQNFCCISNYSEERVKISWRGSWRCIRKYIFTIGKSRGKRAIVACCRCLVIYLDILNFFLLLCQLATQLSYDPREQGVCSDVITMKYQSIDSSFSSYPRGRFGLNRKASSKREKHEKKTRSLKTAASRISLRSLGGINKQQNSSVQFLQGVFVLDNCRTFGCRKSGVGGQFNRRERGPLGWGVSAGRRGGTRSRKRVERS